VIDLAEFAEQVGAEGPVTITGLGTRGGPVSDVRTVNAPAGVEWLQADEMTVSCGAGTPVKELVAALGEVGQTISIPPTGTVGGALAVGRSGIRRLGRGPLRDVLLQTRYVSSVGTIIKAGGPTVKNVTGFDLCRLLVGSQGALGFLGDVILRTQPRPESSRWFAGETDPWIQLGRLYRPASILWDGTTTWVCLEGDPRDVADQAALTGLGEVERPPKLPTGGRWSLAPAALRTALAGTGDFVAEIGVGIVHHSRPSPPKPLDPAVISLNQALKSEYDPTGRLNPGR
jgi:FAD/FMN-containing dehydrogenase